MLNLDHNQSGRGSDASRGSGVGRKVGATTNIQPEVPDGGRPDTELSGELETQEPAKPAKKAKPQTDSVFEQYQPRSTIKGAKPHPSPLAESAAMASAEAPKLTYAPNLPKSVVDNGLLSDAQLENIAYAGQSHENMLPNGTRRGFFIGDGTGVSNGLQIAGIILDIWRQRRKKAV